MKARIITVFSLVLIIFLSTGYAAKESSITPDLENRIEMAINTIKKNLDNTDNLGLRNDAIYQIVQIRSLYPETNLNQFKKKLGKIAMKDPQLMIRTHAFLAMAYLSDDRLVSEVNLTINLEEPETFFERVDHIVHSEFWANVVYEKDSGVYETFSAYLK